MKARLAPDKESQREFAEWCGWQRSFALGLTVACASICAETISLHSRSTQRLHEEDQNGTLVFIAQACKIQECDAAASAYSDSDECHVTSRVMQ